MCYYLIMSQDLDLSFVIVTNGNRDGLLHTIIEGIRYQKIPQYEIIIIGYSRIDRRLYPEVNYIEAKDLAEAGLLGAMRTLACSQAKFNNIVISDDDMILSSNWYEELKKSEDFQILTTQVRNPDGTRFWDHVCFRSPKYGHIVLESNEQDDDYMYMSGGQSWIMKKEVAEVAVLKGAKSVAKKLAFDERYLEVIENHPEEWIQICSNLQINKYSKIIFGIEIE